MDLINQYFRKMIDRTQALELENSNLKKSQNSDLDKLRKEFSSLSERHKELKEAFLESENQVRALTHEKNEIIQKEKEFSEQIKNTFEQQFSSTNSQKLAEQMSFDNSFPQTPKKLTSNLENESQKMKHLKAKKAPRKLVFKNMYESDSDDTDDAKFQEPNSLLKFNNFINSKLENFDYKPDQNTLFKDEQFQDDESIDVIKKLINNDLWNCIEASVSPDQQHKSSQTKPIVNVEKPVDDELLLLTNMFGNFLRSQVSGNKK
jgi:hypothetical protein